MIHLNPATIDTLNEIDVEKYKVFKTAYRVLRLAYFGKIFLPQDTVKPVSSSSELAEAQQLVYREYLRKNLCSENPSGMYYTPYTLLPSTVTLCARRKGRMTGTCSLIEDGALGLPSDNLYKAELDKFREQGHKLVEIGSLATDRLVSGGRSRSLGSIRKFNLVMNLFSGVMRYLYRHSDATHIVIMVAEKHKHLYEVIGFKQFSEVRRYELVNTVAVPLIGDIEQFLEACSEHLPAMYMVKTFSSLMSRQKYKISAIDLALRAEMNPKFFLDLSPKAAAVLSAEFPRFITILDFLRLYSDYFVRDFETQTHELWLRYQQELRNFLAPPDLSLNQKVD